MKRYFVMGDIHGSYRALKEVLEKVNFDYENDVLIQLGDIADGWSETFECVEELMRIKNLIAIRGNHDQWFFDWFMTGHSNKVWEMHGGKATKDSYINNFGLTDHRHKMFWTQQIPYYNTLIDGKNCLFTHGGFNRHETLEEQEDFIFAWDRDLWMAALSHSRMEYGAQLKHNFRMKDSFDKVFIGHTPVQHWGSSLPMTAANITNMDTGCAFKGTLSIMDIITGEVTQSTPSYLLYPDESGRN